MRTPAVLAGLSILLVLTGCGDAPPTGAGEPPQGPDALGAGTWLLTSATIDGAGLRLFEDHPVTLARTDDGIGGRSACNHYFGTVSASGGRLSFDGLGGTDMACLGGGVMELEAAYLGALARVTAAQRRGEGLVLTGDGVELVFAPVRAEPDADLTGG